MLQILLCLFALFTYGTAYGWGELGHHLIGRTAAKLVADTAALQGDGSDSAKQLISIYDFRWYQQGHLANIPDIYWRDLENGLKPVGERLGNATHYINLEKFLPVSPSGEVDFSNFSLNYAEAKKRALQTHPGLEFFKVGTLPWRAEQLASLYARALARYPKGSCESLQEIPLHPTREVLTYSGILGHFVGDASQPYHSTIDHDGEKTGQGGVHKYFETDLVDSLEGSLDSEVLTRARKLTRGAADMPRSVAWFHARVEKLFGKVQPESEVTAMLFAEISDSLSRVPEARANDRKYALAPAEEAWKMEDCRNLPRAIALKEEFDKATTPEAKRKIALELVESEGHEHPACRRKPGTLVDDQGRLSAQGKSISERKYAKCWRVLPKRMLRKLSSAARS